MRKFISDVKADMGGAAMMMGVVIATLIAIVIGVLIWYKINIAMYAAASGVGSGPHAGVNASWLALNSSANTVWTLFPIVCIVLIAGIILAIVTNFGRGQAV